MKKRGKVRRGRSSHSALGDWFVGQIQTTSLVWLIGIFIAGVVFYVTVTFKLDAHDKVFTEIKESLNKNQEALKESKKTESTEREKVRTDFLADSKATAQGIADLNKSSAVMGTILISVKEELVKLNQRMDGLPAYKR